MNNVLNKCHSGKYQGLLKCDTVSKKYKKTINGQNIDFYVSDYQSKSEIIKGTFMSNVRGII